MSNGWISLHRELLDKPIWICSTPEQKTILITLLLLANHKEGEWDWGGKRFKVKKGEFVTSLESIRKSAGRNIGIRQIRTAIDRFRNLEFLTYKATKTGRVITILNFEKYQRHEEEDRQRDRQTGDKQVTTNNNDNNEIKLKYRVKVSIPDHFHLTDQMKQYAEDKFYMGDLNTFTEKFILTCKSNPTKYKYMDWYSAWQKWLLNDMKYHPEHKGQEMVDL